MTITRISHMVVLAFGWRRAAIAFLAGALSTLALSPFNFWPILFLTFPVLIWLLDGVTAGRWRGAWSAGVVGWWFGFGYFVAGLYWIGHAFLVDAKTFGWLLPIAVTALPAALALFTACGFAAASALWTRGPSRILTLAMALTAAEWLRGHLFSGFPWNTFGYALTGPLTLAQTAALIGIWGLTFVAVAVFATPAVLADEPVDTRRRWLPPLLAVGVLLAMTGYGALRLAQTPTAFVPDVRLRIMQPNLQQDEKFFASKQDVMRRYLALSDRSKGPQADGVKDVTHLIWPESAFPFFLTREPDALAQIANLLPQGTVLITGAARLADRVPDSAHLRAYNSVYVIDHDGSILTVYDKVHLVPFGEYLPFQNFLEKSLGLMQLTKLPGGFIPGDRHRSYAIPRAPRFLPLVCYEIIFPGEAVPASDRPDWLLNVTNDAWFGASSGPYQHFQQARVRAIEEGLPLVRAANTGISGVLDPLGRIIRILPLGVEDVLDAPLPVKIGPPPYLKMREAPLIAAFTLVIAIAVRRRLRAKQ